MDEELDDDLIDHFLRVDEEVVVDIGGEQYRQGPFPYQGKCLMWLREAYGALSGGDRSAVDAILDGTGCEQLLR